MADSITLPPLPIRSCIVTYMGDGRGLHYTLGVAAGTALIEQPPGSQLDLHTADQLRARDIEVARLVLEAAAKECEKRERVIGELHADQKPGTEAFWMVQGVMSASRRNAEHIRAMEVRHHE